MVSWSWLQTPLSLYLSISRYDNHGKDQQVQSLSGQGGGGGGPTPYLTLSQVKDLPLGHREKGDYFNCRGAITYIKKENIVYKV